MKKVSLLLVFLMTSSKLLAADSGSGNVHRFKLAGFYGIAFVSPKDFNDNANAQVTNPKLNSISTGTVFGGSLGFRLSPRFEIEGMYESLNAKNLVATNVNGSSGWELNQNEVWLLANYFLVLHPIAYIYVGGGAGYPTYSHATLNLSSKTEDDADKTVAYRAQLGLGFRVVHHVSIFFEGAYEYMISGDVKNSASVALPNSTGANAKLDLSGARADAGVALHF